jgi:hypothetical protein
MFENNGKNLRFDPLWAAFEYVGDHVVARVTQTEFKYVVILYQSHPNNCELFFFCGILNKILKHPSALFVTADLYKLLGLYELQQMDSLMNL